MCCIQGPNFIWHLDGGYDLNGFAICGCIDGYDTRHILLYSIANNYNIAVFAAMYQLLLYYAVREFYLLSTL